MAKTDFGGQVCNPRKAIVLLWYRSQRGVWWPKANQRDRTLSLRKKRPSFFFLSEKHGFQTVWNDWNMVEDFLENKHYCWCFAFQHPSLEKKHISLRFMGPRTPKARDLYGWFAVTFQGPLAKPWDGKQWCWSWHVISASSMREDGKVCGMSHGSKEEANIMTVYIHWECLIYVIWSEFKVAWFNVW